MRRRAILSLIASCSLAACAHQSPPTAMPGMGWSLNHVEGEGVKLAFGQPQSDNVLIMMSCEPKSGQVLVWANAPGKTRPVLELSSGRTKARYMGAIGPAIGEGTVIEAQARAADPVFSSFASSGELAVTIDGHRTTVPGDRAKVREFLSVCRT
jgi:hypothetical protein